MRRILVVCMIAIATPASAGPQCTNEPADKWIPKEDLLNKIVAEGYKVGVFKVTTGKCYELYGMDKAGKRVEIYYNPVSGDVVKMNSR